MLSKQSTLAISLADLEAFDAAAARGGIERVSRCPICEGQERAFHFNTSTGVYNCKRASCGETGKLSDFWQDRPPVARRQRARAALTRAFALPDTLPAPTSSAAPDATWREGLASVQPLRSTPGAAYLEGRGLCPDLAHENGVRFSPDWAPRRSETAEYSGGAAVVFPITDNGGSLVAVNGRYIHATAKPKTRIGGAASNGVYSTFAALRCEIVTLCEGPMDALSLQLCGFSAVALNGCNLPEWLPGVLAFKKVLVASDADAAGDKAASEWTAALQSFGARCARFKPYQAKDFNEMLQRDGTRAASAYLRARLDHIRRFEWRE